MDFRFKYELQALDLWKISMYGIYSSMMGMVNIVFFVSMILLTKKFWATSSFFIRILLLAGIALFTIIQPLTIYLRAKKQVKTLPDNMYISFNKEGVHIETPEKSNTIIWSNLSGVKKIKNTIIIYLANGEGYILTEKILGENRFKFLDYLASKTNKYIK